MELGSFGQFLVERKAKAVHNVYPVFFPRVTNFAKIGKMCSILNLCHFMRF